MRNCRSPSAVTTSTMDCTSPSDPAGSEISNFPSPRGTSPVSARPYLSMRSWITRMVFATRVSAVRPGVDPAFLLRAVEVQGEAQRGAALQVLAQAHARHEVGDDQDAR